MVSHNGRRRGWSVVVTSKYVRRFHGTKWSWPTQSGDAAAAVCIKGVRSPCPTEGLSDSHLEGKKNIPFMCLARSDCFCELPFFSPSFFIFSFFLVSNEMFLWQRREVRWRQKCRRSNAAWERSTAAATAGTAAARARVRLIREQPGARCRGGGRGKGRRLFPR